jgi:Bcr/CflA subfamily drug resistance transporter
MSSEFKVTAQEFKALSIVMVVAICGMLGIDIHLASMPHIMTFMHTNQQRMQQSVSIFLLGMGASLLFYGPLSDCFGRKPIVIFGLLLAAIASFSSVFTTHINTFLLMRLLQGVGSGVCIGLGRTIIADILQGDRFAVIGSYFSMFVTLSPMFAPALGGYIQQRLDWQANFFTLGSILTATLLLYAFFCPETNKHKNPMACIPTVIFHNYKALLSHTIFVGCTFMTGIAISAAMVYSTLSPFIFQIQFHLSPVFYGWLTAIAGLGGLVGKFINTKSIQKIGSQKTLFVGFIFLLGSGLWLLFFIALKHINIPLIMIPVFFTIFAQGFITPNSGSKALSPFHDKRGSAGALYGSFQMLAAFFVTGFVGLLVQDGVTLLAWSYIVLGFLGVLIYYFIFMRRKESKK